MKLIEAIKIIEEREKRERMSKKDKQKVVVVKSGTNRIINNIVAVQTLLPQEDVIALKVKTGESSVKEAISKAVDHYLKCCMDDGECNH